jgi:hypothetical protein
MLGLKSRRSPSLPPDCSRRSSSDGPPFRHRGGNRLVRLVKIGGDRKMDMPGHRFTDWRICVCLQGFGPKIGRSHPVNRSCLRRGGQDHWGVRVRPARNSCRGKAEPPRWRRSPLRRGTRRRFVRSALANQPQLRSTQSGRLLRLSESGAEGSCNEVRPWMRALVSPLRSTQDRSCDCHRCHEAGEISVFLSTGRRI